MEKILIYDKGIDLEHITKKREYEAMVHYTSKRLPWDKNALDRGMMVLGKISLTNWFINNKFNNNHQS